MTHFELYEVRLSCGVIGTMRFAGDAGEASTSFREILARQSVTWEATVSLDSFQRATFHIQVGYAAESSGGDGALDDSEEEGRGDGMDGEEDVAPSYEGGGMDSASWELPTHASETVIRCTPYTVNPKDLFRALPCQVVEFRSIWDTLEASRVIKLGVGSAYGSDRGLLNEDVVDSIRQSPCFHLVQGVTPRSGEHSHISLIGRAMSGEIAALAISCCGDPNLARLEIRGPSRVVVDVLTDPDTDLMQSISQGRLRTVRSQ